LAAQVKRLAREPFVHFLFFGALIFLVNAQWGKQQSNNNAEIVVSATEVARLQAQWQSQYNRPPSATERDAIIQNYIREEALYREAMALGLADDDLIVKRRLVQKFMFFSEDLMEVEIPSDQVLRDYYSKHQDRYRIPAKTTFSHVYFSSANKDKNAKQAAIDLMAALQIDETNWRSQGDPFMLRREYTALEDQEITKLFGEHFTVTLNSLTQKAWRAPVQSAFGWHTVKVHKRSTPALPLLSEVRETVIADYKRGKKAEVSDAFYSSVQDRYSISIESKTINLDNAVVSAQ